MTGPLEHSASSRARGALVAACGSFALLVAAGAGVMACASPTQDALIESLGEEVDGVPRGELHRYGQPCLACHGGYGPGSPQFSIAGTVFAQPDDEIPVSGARVVITDSTGEKTTLRSNCAGNFYAQQGDYAPVYPIRVEVICSTPPGFDGATTTYRNVMGTRINREGSCAGCHDNEPASQDGPGRVYCMDARLNNPFTLSDNCAGGPKRGDASGAAASSAASTGADAATSTGAGQ